MSIDLDDLDESPLPTSQDNNEVAVGDIYAQLLAEESVIVTIDKSVEEPLRKALSAVKTRETSRLKNAGIPVDNTRLTFVTLPRDKDMADGDVRIQIILGKPRSLPIKKIEPAGEF
jgi:hypothetical protein